MYNWFLSRILFLKNTINKGHARSVVAKKNILASFLIKGFSIVISLILVPLTIQYLNPTKYGIWITLSSVVIWFSFFDIGFGNGLRNKFTESVSKGDHQLARIYVSTTYAIITGLIGVVLVLFLIINPFLNWTKILNTTPDLAGELSVLALIVFVFFCFQFVLQLLTTVLTANQEPAKASLFNLIGSMLSLVLIFILTKISDGNLIYLATALSAAPVLILAVSSVWLYRTKYKKYAPSFKLVSFRYARNLMDIGLQFFVIQIGALILFQTDNIIITQLFGPQEVTVFNTAYKLFSVVIMIFTIIVTPLWSAFTEAYTKSDFLWIKSTMSKMKKIWLLQIILTVLILISSSWIFNFWVGDQVKIPFTLSLSLSLYVIVCTWQSIHVYLLNGIGKIKLQLYLVTISGIVNIPLSLFLGKKFGLAGITFANTLLFFIMGIFFYIQTNKIINQKANGIWNK